MSKLRLGVVLFQLGGPDCTEAVEPFLKNLLSDPFIMDFPLGRLLRRPLARVISKRRAPEVIEQYRLIGGRSPIKEITLMQASNLQSVLAPGFQCKIVAAMRYSNPNTIDAVRELSSFSPEVAVLLPLYPQYSHATTGSSFCEWDKCKRELNAVFKKEIRINGYHVHPMFVDAWVEIIRNELKNFNSCEKKDIHILFSAHGLPVKFIKRGDPYQEQIENTVKRVMLRGGFPNPHSLSYQSRVGPLEWIGPPTISQLERLGGRGEKAVLVVPVSFVSDHLETLYELGISLKQTAESKGIREYRVCPVFNDSLAFADALAAVAIEKLGSYIGE